MVLMTSILSLGSGHDLKFEVQNMSCSLLLNIWLRLGLGYPGDLFYAIVLELTVPCMMSTFYQISFTIMFASELRQSSLLSYACYQT